MKKFYNVVKIILISTAILLGAAFGICYIVNPVLARQIQDVVVDYINRPLPIAGVSVATAAILIWKIFSATKYGKRKIAEMKAEYEREKTDLVSQNEAYKNICTGVLGCFGKELDVVFDSVSKVCNASPNKKIKEIGNQLTTQVTEVRKDLKDKYESISTATAEILVESKEEIINAIVESVKKELVEKYGEEAKEKLNSISEAKKI